MNPTTLAWAAAAGVALLPILYPALGLASIVRGCDVRRGYWRRRLILNLLENNLGMFMALGLAVGVAILLEDGGPFAWRLMLVAALVDAVYSLLILFATPRDWWHALPMLLALGCYAAARIVA
jgi:hypothetical protein